MSRFPLTIYPDGQALVALLAALPERLQLHMARDLISAAFSEGNPARFPDDHPLTVAAIHGDSMRRAQEDARELRLEVLRLEQDLKNARTSAMSVVEMVRGCVDRARRSTSDGLPTGADLALRDLVEWLPCAPRE